MNPHADSVQQPSETFAAWLSREMPAGTVISDPAWWAPRIERALARFGTRPAADPRSLTAAEHQVLREAVWDSAEIVHPGIAAEPIQSGSAGEAELPSPYNIINGVWYYSAEQMRAAISRQAPAAPAEAGRSDQWGRLYTTANTLVASIGYMGEIDSRADEVASLMDALHDLDGGQWMPGLTPAASPAAPTQALLGWTRYEKARKLNPAQWAELHQRNIRGENFDDMIDALPATTQPAQQDWKDAEAATIPKLTIQTRSTPTAPTWADLLFAFGGFLTSHEKRWVFSSRDDASPMVEAIREFAARECINLDATPPAEKQAAPSGEDK